MTEEFDPRIHFATLELPKQDLAKLSFCSSNKVGPLENWADRLQMTRITHTSAQLYQHLPEINRLKTDAKTRLNMLELLRPTVHNIQLGLAQDFLGHSLIEPGPAQKAAIVSQALQKTMINGYSICLRDWLAQRNLTAQNREQAALALSRAIAGIGRLYLRACQMYTHLPVGLWVQLHGLYRTAQHLGLQSASVSDPLLQWRRELPIRDAYTRPLMLACSRTNQLNQAEMEALFDATETWAARVNLSEEVDPENDNPFVVNLSRDVPPVYKTLFDGSETDYLLEPDFHSLLSALGPSRHIGSGVEIPPNMPQQLIRHLISAWGKVASRRSQRRRVKTIVDVCVGLTDCHYYLTGQKTFTEFTGDVEPPTDDDAFVPAALTPAERARHNVDQPARTPKRVTVQNISAGGYCLHWSGTMPESAVTGQLVGIREAGREAWLIGVIRWIRQLRGGSQIGVQVLALESAPASGSVMYDMGGYSNPMRVLQLPLDDEDDTPASVITPAAPFQESQRVRLELPNRRVMLKLGTCLFSTGHMRQFSYQVLTSETVQERATQPAPASRDEFDSDWD